MLVLAWFGVAVAGAAVGVGLVLLGVWLGRSEGRRLWRAKSGLDPYRTGTGFPDGEDTA